MKTMPTTPAEILATSLKKAFKGKKAVTVRVEDGAAIVRHYTTDIVKFTDANTVLNLSYQSATTKKHINAALQTAGISAYVSQQDFTWYIIGDDGTGVRNHELKRAAATHEILAQSFKA